MKKIALIISLVFSLSVLLTGCGIGSQFKDDADLTRVSGTLMTQTRSDSRSGTHILVADDGVTEYAVRSLSLNLSGDGYLGNKVDLIGTMSSDEIFEVTGISVLEILKKSESGADFIGYKNSDYGFEIMYYEDWAVDEGDNSVSFTAPITDNESVSDWVEVEQESFHYSSTVSSDGTEGEALEAYFEKNFPGLENYNAYLNKVGKDHMDALKFDNGADGMEYYLYRSGLIYKIVFNPSRNFDESNLKSFSEMVSEFRFLGFTVDESNGIETDLGEVQKLNEVLDTKGSIEDVVVAPKIDIKLTFFESLPYFFKASYPVSWYYSGTKGIKSGVLHHYGFSEDADGDEVISLNVISSSSVEEGKLSSIPSGDSIKVYTKVDGQSYELMADKKYKDLLQVMAGSIERIER